MRIHWLIPFVTLFGLLEVFAIPSQEATLIEGVVLDRASNEPIAGAQVWIDASDSNQRAPSTSAPQGTTDAQGRFSLQINQVGRIRLVSMKAGFIPVRSRPSQLPGVWVEALTGRRIGEVQLRMARTAAISGTLLNASGQVSADTLVSLRSYTFNKDGKRVLDNVPGLNYRATTSSLLTNDKGEFRLYDLPAGEYYLAFLSDNAGVAVPDPGYSYYPGVTEETSARAILVTAGDEVRLGVITLPVRPNPVEVRLRIVSPTGRSLSAQVSLGGTGFSTSSGSSSMEVSKQAVPGRYTIRASDTGTRFEPDYYYDQFIADITPSNSVYDVVLKRGPLVTGKMLIENEAGVRSAPPTTIRCMLDGRSTQNCLLTRTERGTHTLEFEGLPRDTYVLSAQVGGKDILAEGFEVTSDTELEIILAQPGAIVLGAVRNESGDLVPNAVVALVPDTPYRNAGPRYRTVITDYRGQFEIHGIAPASYKLFAWSEIDGAAYRNPEFIKEFENRAKTVDVPKVTRMTVDLIAQ